jgi:hypothetical protein
MLERIVQSCAVISALAFAVMSDAYLLVLIVAIATETVRML